MATDIQATLSKVRWNFFLATKRWKQFSPTPTLKWRSVQFSLPNHKLVPSKSGLYAFVAKVQNAHLPEHGYVMYVGETGQKNGRTLYERYGDYLRWKNREKRPVVRDMFRHLGGDLSFYFAPVSAKHAPNLGTLETRLLDALIPPCNETDFSLDVAHARKILWRK